MALAGRRGEDRHRRGTVRGGETAEACDGVNLWLITKLAIWFCKILAGSFSAVAKRTFESKHVFDNIFQVLQDVHTFALLRSQNFSKKSI